MVFDIKYSTFIFILLTKINIISFLEIFLTFKVHNLIHFFLKNLKLEKKEIIFKDYN